MINVGIRLENSDPFVVVSVEPEGLTLDEAVQLHELLGKVIVIAKALETHDLNGRREE